MAPANVLAETYFYPRPPRGGRPSIKAIELKFGTFLSTPSARRATAEDEANEAKFVFLSTPSARRATQPKGATRNAESISIHALREEGDFFADAPAHHFDLISIHALREEGDPGDHPRQRDGQISIHALREEGDRKDLGLERPGDRISIHALREEGDASCYRR